MVGALHRRAVELAKRKRKSAVRTNITQRKRFSGGVAPQHERHIKQHRAHKFSAAYLFAPQRWIPESPHDLAGVISCCHGIDVAHYFCCFADASTPARMLSRAARSKNRPSAITQLIFCVLRISSSGFALKRTRSAALPGSMDPKLPSTPKNLLGLLA